jgi:hypothetical protein
MPKEQLEEMVKDIEDWLDADSHSNRLPPGIMFKDIQVIAELLAPNILEKVSQAYLKGGEDERMNTRQKHEIILAKPEISLTQDITSTNKE